MNKHTPGPWRLCNGDHATMCIYDDKNQRVAVVPIEGHFANISPNARLIAAAPELLDVLKSARSALEHPSAAYTVYALKVMDDLIKKVEGR